MKNKNVVIFVLIAILFSPHPAQARRVREVESYSAEDIANIIVRSEPFYRHEPMFLSGIPNEMSKDVADAIDKIVRGSEAVFISFSDLVERIKGWREGLLEWLGEQHLIIYGFSPSSQENGYTADDVAMVIAKLQEWRMKNNDRYLMHLIISQDSFDPNTFNPSQLASAQFNNLRYFEIVNGKLKEYLPFYNPKEAAVSAINEESITNAALDIENKLGLSSIDSLDITRRIAAISRDKTQMGRYIGNINGVLGVRLYCSSQRDAQVNSKALMAIKEFVGLMEILKDEARIDKLFGLVRGMNEKLNEYEENAYPIIYKDTFIALSLILERNIFLLDGAIREARRGIEVQDPSHYIIAFGAYPM